MFTAMCQFDGRNSHYARRIGEFVLTRIWPLRLNMLNQVEGMEKYFREGLNRFIKQEVKEVDELRKNFETARKRRDNAQKTVNDLTKKAQMDVIKLFQSQQRLFEAEEEHDRAREEYFMKLTELESNCFTVLKPLIQVRQHIESQ